jgi:putative transposase
LKSNACEKENQWTQSIAVGNKTFIEKTKETLGFRAKGRKIISTDGAFELREGQASYGEDDAPR